MQCRNVTTRLCEKITKHVSRITGIGRNHTYSTAPIGGGHNDVTGTTSVTFTFVFDVGATNVVPRTTLAARKVPPHVFTSAAADPRFPLPARDERSSGAAARPLFRGTVGVVADSRRPTALWKSFTRYATSRARRAAFARRVCTARRHDVIMS